eukprot:TRINITY_DN55173_c0_g1_i1.p1 TRINITY_DN55173_c0_g1~~TRINITY_DN55173_c0_g1_i1.p1  ORF type:complete len:259 (+),score=71.52 TRINITY_DN55173_c0_g1_i1:74-778(+)
MPPLGALLARAADFSDIQHLASPAARGAFGPGRLLPGGVTVHARRTADSPVHMLLGLLEIGATVGQFQACLGFDRRGEWDDMFLEGRDLKAYPADSSQEAVHVFHRYMAFRSPSRLVRNRDFEVVVAEKLCADGSFLAKAESVTPSQTPPRKGFVRGEIRLSGFVVRPLAARRLQVTYIAQMDPKGWVPPQIVNLIATRQAGGIQRLREYLRHGRVPEQRDLWAPAAAAPRPRL